jgi:hypothetical protein
MKSVQRTDESAFDGPNHGNTSPFIIRYRLGKLPVRCYGFFVCFLVTRATRPLPLCRCPFSCSPTTSRRTTSPFLEFPYTPSCSKTRRPTPCAIWRTCRYAQRFVLAQGTSGLHRVALYRGPGGPHRALPNSSLSCAALPQARWSSPAIIY